MDLDRYEFTESNTSMMARIPALFISAWLAMLVLGDLGYRLHMHQLFIDYWTCLLIELAAGFLFGRGTTTYTFKLKKEKA